MRLWNPWYAVAVVLPILFLALLPPEGTVNAESVEAKIWNLSQDEYYGTGNEDLSPVTPYSGVAPQFQPLADLSDVHPQNASIIVRAWQRCDATDSRVAGPWESTWDMPRPDAFSTRPLSALKKSDIALGLALARRGQKLEPNNTVFDWMAARFLFASFRDAEAIQVLLRASHKTGYDMHLRDLMPAGYAKYSAFHPLLTEEKWFLFEIQSGILQMQSFGHTHAMALWCAMQRESAGNVQGALEIEGALIRLYRIVMQRAVLTDEVSRAKMHVLRVWEAPEMMQRARNFNRSRRRLRSFPQYSQIVAAQAQDFIGYATAHGAVKVAQESRQLVPPVATMGTGRDYLDFAMGSGFLQSQGSGAVSALYLSWWGVVLALWQLGIALGLGLFFLIWGPILPPRGEAVPYFSNRVILSSLLVGGILWLLGTGLSQLSWILIYPGGEPGVATLVGGIVSAGIALLAPFLVGSGLCIWGTFRIIRRQPHPVEPYFSKPRDLGASQDLELLHVWFWVSLKVFWFRVLPVLNPLLAMGYAAVTVPLHLPLGNQGAWIPVMTPLSVNWWYVTAMAVAQSLYCISLFVRWRFFMPREQRPAVYAGFHAFRRVLAWSIPLALWLMLLSLLLGVPARRAFDGQLENYLNSEAQS